MRTSKSSLFFHPITTDEQTDEGRIVESPHRTTCRLKTANEMAVSARNNARSLIAQIKELEVILGREPEIWLQFMTTLRDYSPSILVDSEEVFNSLELLITQLIDVVEQLKSEIKKSSENPDDSIALKSI